MNLDALLRIKADVVGEQNIQRLGNSMKGLQGNVQNAALSMKALGAAVAGSAVVAGFTGIIKKATEAGDQLFALQQKTGISAQSLIGIGNAAKLADVDIEVLGKGLTKLNIALANAGAGNKEAAQKFAGLGVSIKNATGQILPADQVLKKLADRFADMPDGAGKAAAAVALFGKAGTALIPLLNEGAKSMEQFTYKISDDFAARSDLFNDTITTMQIKANGFGLELTDAMLPALQSILDEFGKLFDSKNNWTALFDIIKVGLRGVATVIFATIQLVDQFTKRIVFTFDAIGKAIKGDFSGAGQALAKGATDSANKFKENEKAFQRIWTDAPSPGTGRRTGGTAADLSAMGVAGAAAAQPFKLSSRGQALVAAARKLGVSPLDLATIIDFETGGAYNPSMMGGAGGNYMGLIQFGAPERQQYGAYKGQSFEEQVQGPVVRFLKDRFASVGKSTEGADLLSLYRTVLGGNPNANINAQDAFGTSPASGVARMGANKRRALDTFFGGTIKNVPYGAAEAGANVSDRFDAEKKIREEAEKRLTTAKDLLDKNLSTFQILQAETPLQKLAAEYDEKRANRMREYAEKYKSALSDQETQTLISAQSLDALNSEMNYAIQASQLVAEQISVIDNGLIGFTSMLSETSPIIENIASTIGSGIGSAIDSLITGTKSWGDSLREIGSSVLKDIVKQLLQMSVVGPATKGIGNLLGSLFPAAIGAIVPGISAVGGPAFGMNAATGGVAGFGMPSLMANGGIMTTSGPMPLKRYANGGIANSPQLAMYGEGRKPEAYVPLPDGRSIPVKLDAAGALGRYPRLDAGGNSGDTATGAGADNNTVLAMNFETTQFLGQDWVSKDQLMAAMAATEKRATAAGAKAGAQQVATKMRTSPAFRRQVGVK
jgi:hypothetical protein